MRRYGLTLILSLFCATAVLTAGSDLYVVPIAGHVRGANATAWRTDVVLHNHQTVPITVETLLVESGRSAASDPIAIPLGAEPALQLAPGETRVLTDVLGRLGRDVAGALVIGADLPFAVTTRTYAENRTLGQTVLPTAIAGGVDASGGLAVLPGLTQDDRQRSNVGMFIAASRAPLVVAIEIRALTGLTVGSELIIIDTPGLAHRQFSVGRITPGVDRLTAVVRILEGDGIVVPYASTVDNATAEALFVSPGPLTSGGPEARSALKASLRGRR